ncbi:AraC family transcriptional regulator [Vibrio europaeus]|uniref:AraC family transcriptional regulator n=1 Tax=Vibrio europaeus TaxID=300876 RepID=UPI00233F1E99|nr:AraC family transcriptional regulator [Vibrio europaeus]MDC5818692.1 helix-turn-helix domain-containing protein [Vibrio europaeus]MDC5856868.1 helix-turn-helix domain-containing protein [Vibrio europaeus]MDC5871285.1 helix-turn-helix domain-containing protein [Vibrio europaeus]
MDFRIVKPQGKLSGHIQAIWSVSTLDGQHNTTQKPLYCDGGSGVTFVLSGVVGLSNTSIREPILVQKYNHKTQIIEISPGAQLCGIRFHPGMMLPSLISNESQMMDLLVVLYDQLAQKNQSGHLATLYRWCEQQTLPDNPDLAKRAMLIKLATQGKIGEQFPYNQRQVERHFRQWLGMSPKYFQRLRRVHSSLSKLRANPYVSLADFAFEHGFSDQAHMTREFKAFVLTTPGELSRRLKATS